MILSARYGVVAASLPAGAPPETLGGMVLLTPTSIAYTGTSATVGANGSVEFSACTSLSLNGVFSADYDNYMISVRMTGSANAGLYFRMRSSGSDNSTASSYVYQQLYANSTSVTAARGTSDFGSAGYVSNAQRGGENISVYGPFLAQPTALRNVGAASLNNASIFDVACTHNQSTSYDGITIYPSSGNFTGLVSVFGLVGA